MYFTNIMNKELEPFHHQLMPNFTITLTNLLTSDLFKVETIQTGSLYRIIPLFYTNTITSTNKEDKILENKAIIAHKKDKETTYTFTTNTTDEVQDWLEYGTYYEVGDSLTDAQFNSIISILLRNTTFTDNITLNNGTVKGEYADYNFNIESTTIIDTGILITRETLSDIGTVTLKEPVFRNATYTLNLTVVHDTDINILEVDDDNTVTETLEIELTPDTPVNIPFETLDYNYVILKEASVVVNHDKPIIRGVQTNTIGVTATKNTLQQGANSTLTFTAYDLNSLPSPNQSLDIYVDGSKVDTLTTNQQGKVEYEYAGVGDGLHTFQAVCDLVESDEEEVLDCLFYDPAKNGETNNGFWVNPYLTLVNDNTGTLVTNTDTTEGRAYILMKPSSNGGYIEDGYIWNEPIIIETDIISGDGTVRVQLIEKGANRKYVQQTLTELGLTNGGHLKITYDGELTKYYVDGTLTYTSNSTVLTNYAIRFYMPTSTSFKYKDFKIYPYEA